MNASSTLNYGSSFHSETSSSPSSPGSLDQREIITLKNQSSSGEGYNAASGAVSSGGSDSTLNEVGMLQLASLTAAASAVERKSNESNYEISGSCFFLNVPFLL